MLLEQERRFAPSLAVPMETPRDRIHQSMVVLSSRRGMLRERVPLSAALLAMPKPCLDLRLGCLVWPKRHLLASVCSVWDRSAEQSGKLRPPQVSPLG